MGDRAGRLSCEGHTCGQRDGVGWRWLLAILLVALTYRGLCFSLLQGYPLFVYPVVDAGFHDSWARRIVCGDFLGHGPDDVFKPPLYPYFLAAIYAPLGRQVHLVQWVQFLLGSLSCVLVGVLAGHLLGRAPGRLAGLISALYAPYVFFELQLLTPAVSIFLNLAAMLLLVRAGEKGRFARDLLAGAVLGLSAGVRPDVMLPATLAVLYLVSHGGATPWRGLLGRVSCIAAAFGGVVLPIAARNYHLTGTVIPISSNAGINFYVGNVAPTNGTSAVPVGLRWEQLVARVPQAVLEQPARANRWWWAEAWQRMQSEPRDTLIRFGKKAAAFLSRREFRNNVCYHFVQRSCWPMRMPFGQYGLILPLAVCGLAALWPGGSPGRREASALCGLWVGSYWILGVVFFVTARFRLPAMPFLIIPSAWAVIQISRVIRNRRPKALLQYGTGLVMVGIVAWPMWFDSPEKGWVRDYVNLGNSLHAAGNVHETEKAYRQALALQSDDPDANYLLARLLLPSSPARALEHLEVARRVLPDSPEVMLAMGQAHAASGDTPQARRVLEELVRLSDSSNLWPKRAAWAMAHVMLAELELSRTQAHWRQAWSIDRRTAAEMSFLKRRDLDRVLGTFRAEALEQRWNWYSQANYGLILLQLGRGDEATTAFLSAIRLAPERDTLKLHLARALLKSGKPAQAAAILDELDRTLPAGPLRHEARELHRQIGTSTAPARHK